MLDMKLLLVSCVCLFGGCALSPTPRKPYTGSSLNIEFRKPTDKSPRCTESSKQNFFVCFNNNNN